MRSCLRAASAAGRRPCCAALSSSAGRRGTVGRLNHVAIAAADAAGHVAFFREILQLEVGARVVAVRRVRAHRQAQPEHGVYTTFVDLGNTKVEMIEPLGAASPIAAFVARNPGGAVHHICYEVCALARAACPP